MTFPANTITVQHLDSDFDFIGLARPEMHHNFLTVGEIIDSYAQPQGICPLDATGQIPSLHMPTEFTSGAENPIALVPGSGFVLLEWALAMSPKTVAELESAAVPAGTIALCLDGDAGALCLAVATGETIGFDPIVPEWKRISLGAQISSVD